jgi:hypothetical protein
MDTIKPYIDLHDQIDGLDYRHSIFIFLSNSAASEIAQLTLEYERANVKRADFELKKFEKIIQNSVYHKKGKFPSKQTDV